MSVAAYERHLKELVIWHERLEKLIRQAPYSAKFLISGSLSCGDYSGSFKEEVEVSNRAPPEIFKMMLKCIQQEIRDTNSHIEYLKRRRAEEQAEEQKRSDELVRRVVKKASGL